MKNLLQRFRNWQIRKGIYVELDFEMYPIFSASEPFYLNPYSPYRKPSFAVGPFIFEGPTSEQIAAAWAI